MPKLEITNDNASAIAVSLKFINKMSELIEDQLKAHSRRGGICIVDGKEYHGGSREGKETASAAKLKEIAKVNDGDSAELAALKKEVLASIKKGDPYEQFSWVKVRR